MGIRVMRPFPQTYVQHKTRETCINFNDVTHKIYILMVTKESLQRKHINHSRMVLDIC